MPFAHARFSLLCDVRLLDQQKSVKRTSVEKFKFTRTSQAIEYFRKTVFLSSMLFSRLKVINCEVCVHIKHVSKSVNSAGLLHEGCFLISSRN